MIIIRSESKYAKVENNFEDDQAEQAFEYSQELEDSGWDRVKWIHLPNLSYKKYIDFWMNRNGGYLK